MFCCSVDKLSFHFLALHEHQQTVGCFLAVEVEAIIVVVLSHHVQSGVVASVLDIHEDVPASVHLAVAHDLTEAFLVKVADELFLSFDTSPLKADCEGHDCTGQCH